MSRIKTGTTVKYSRDFAKDLTGRDQANLVGQADRVIASSPALIYVRWNDGSYNAVSEQDLEAL